MNADERANTETSWISVSSVPQSGTQVTEFATS